MRRGLDWYKREPRAIIDGNRAARMSTRTWAVFDLLIDLIYEGGGQTPDDPAYIAGHFPDIGTAAARREIEHLIALGKIAREGVFLTNNRAKNQAKTRQKLSENRAKAGQKGGVLSGFSRSKTNENNTIAEANASHNAIKEREREKENPPNPPSGGKRANGRGVVLSVLGHVVSEGQAEAFIAHRKAKRRPLTERAAQLVAKNLDAIKSKGGDPELALDLAIEHGWDTIKPDWYARAVERGEVAAQPRASPAPDLTPEQREHYRELARQRQKEREH